MPYVNVQITREGNTREQKEAVIRGITEVLVNVLGKDPATTFVVIQEVAFDDWGQGGMQVDTWRASRS
jgi:4-oxalocrotonate tautomerase